MATKIVLDPGHGGANPGAVYDGRRESDDTLRLAMAVGDILKQRGIDVVYTRTSDISQTVGEKADIANREGADLFVSFHRNAAQYPGQYTGVQTLIYDDSGIKKEMGENINANLEKLGFRNAGISIRPNLVVLNRTQMPALLLEVGFIDSDVDNRLFDTKFNEMAMAIADGITDTLGIQSSDMEMPGGNPGGCMEGMCPDGSDMENGEESPVLYRVQVGAFRERSNAENLLNTLKMQDFPAWLLYEDGYFKVQVGAYAILRNAIHMERQLRKQGYATFITT